MALTGLKIQKLLPKTNCKECGSNTCLAFAMKLAAKKADLSECPYASDEAKQVLGAASEPPVKTLKLGPEEAQQIGGETVLYRHEKTFVHQTLLGVNINDTDSLAEQTSCLQAIADYTLERVGEFLTLDMVAVTHKNEEIDPFVKLARQAWEKTKRPLVLRSDSVAALNTVAQAVEGSGSVLCAAMADTLEALVPVAQDNGHALALTAADLNTLMTLSERAKALGLKDLVLQFQTFSLAEQFQTNSIARRAAIKHNQKPLGYPSLSFIDVDNPVDVMSRALLEIDKYGGICIMPRFDAAQLSALLTHRLNIYTDPQKPIQVEPKLYPVGDPQPEAPVFVTTNFSLTYFIVSGEIENSGTSAWLVVPECEGMSVLTSWAAGKFSGASIAKFVKEIELEKQITSREIIIPGYVASISGELEEGLPGWTVTVGPQEAADIESFVKARLA